MENQENQQEPTTNKTSPTLWVSIILVIIVLGVGVYFMFMQDDTTNTNNANTTVNSNNTVNENVNTVSNTNIETNTNTEINTNSSINLNTNTTSNTNVDTSGWETYENSKYNFTVYYPQELIKWETEISEAVRNQRGDGLRLDVGFRPEDLQGSIFVIRVFSKSIEEVTKSSQEFGELTNEIITINGKTATKMSAGTNRYGIDGDEYSYIVEVNNFRDNDDLEIFDEIFDKLIIN